MPVRALQFSQDVLRLKTPNAVLSILDSAIVSPGISVWGAWQLPRQSVKTEILRPDRPAFYPSKNKAIEKFWPEYQAAVNENNISMLGTLARRRSAPFTFVEAKAQLQLDADYWVFQLARKYGMDDGLYCPFRRWAFVFQSDRPIKLTEQNRGLLFLLAGSAVGRLEQLIPQINFAKHPITSEARIGLRLRHLREQGHMTQRDLAKRLGVTFQMIQKYERGENLTIKRIMDIAAIFALTQLEMARQELTDWIFDGH